MRSPDEYLELVQHMTDEERAELIALLNTTRPRVPQGMGGWGDLFTRHKAVSELTGTPPSWAEL